MSKKALDEKCSRSTGDPCICGSVAAGDLYGKWKNDDREYGQF